MVQMVSLIALNFEVYDISCGLAKSGEEFELEFAHLQFALVLAQLSVT